MIIASIGRTSRPPFDPRARAARRSTMNALSPSVFFATSASGVVRASRTIRSECSTRLIQTFWPVIRQPAAVRSAPGRQRRGVGARARLGDAEGLEPQVSRRDRRQIGRLLRRRAMAQERSHHIHLRMARPGMGAAARDLLEDRTGLPKPEPRAAIGLGDQRGEEPRRRHLAHELRGIPALRVQPAPVVLRIARAELRHRSPDLVDVCRRCVHGPEPIRLPRGRREQARDKRAQDKCRAHPISQAKAHVRTKLHEHHTLRTWTT